MCTVSGVGDYYGRTIPQQYPWVQQPASQLFSVQLQVSRAEFDALRAEVLEMKALLKAAKRIDEITGQPDCEQDEKVALLRKFAELVGVDLEDVLG